MTSTLLIFFWSQLDGLACAREELATICVCPESSTRVCGHTAPLPSAPVPGPADTATPLLPVVTSTAFRELAALDDAPEDSTDENDPCDPGGGYPGFRGVDRRNSIWTDADCDGDLIPNGQEAALCQR